MFAGHFAASVAAKAAVPRLPFWACVGAAQLIDIGWAVMVWAGVERLRVVPGLPGSPLDLYHMPCTHSLVMAGLWSLLAGLLAARYWGRAGWWIGAVVFSHWLADLLVHRPDLALWPGSEIKLGLGLWNLPELAVTLELGLLGFAMAWWTARRAQAGLALRPALGWFGALLVLTAINEVPGEPPTPAGMAAISLLAFAVMIGVGWLVDRADSRR
jgi:membrane-bound metal-dependent hydrolase YbcI (DUF457 family)